jgi:hypothetical protein
MVRREQTGRVVAEEEATGTALVMAGAMEVQEL